MGRLHVCYLLLLRQFSWTLARQLNWLTNTIKSPQLHSQSITQSISQSYSDDIQSVNPLTHGQEAGFIQRALNMTGEVLQAGVTETVCKEEKKRNQVCKKQHCYVKKKWIAHQSYTGQTALILNRGTRSSHTEPPTGPKQLSVVPSRYSLKMGIQQYTAVTMA